MKTSYLPITNRGTRANVQDGIGFVPQGNRVFDEMTVLENLEIGGLHLSENRFKVELKKMWELFPELEKERNKTQENLAVVRNKCSL